MRIVYLNPSGQMGGAETSLLQLLSSVRRARPEWQLRLVLGEDGPLARYVDALGVPVMIEPFPAGVAGLGDATGWPIFKLGSLLRGAYDAWAYKRRLRRLLQREKPDIIHSNGFKMHVFAVMSRPGRTSVVWHIHDYVGRRPVMSRLLKRYAGKCAVAVANSHSVADDVSALCPGLPVTTIYNAVNLTTFSARGKKLDLDALAGLPPAVAGTLRIGMVATFARWKGHITFLQALSLLPAGLPVRGYIIGGPIYQTRGSQCSFDELRLEAARLELSGKVGFTGFVEDSAAAMRSLDIVVHASTQPEPFGMIIIEAWACGRALIVSQAGGAAELFTTGEDALPHLPGDIAGLAEQIVRLITDAPLRQKLGHAGRVTAEKYYHQDRLAQEFTALYSGLAEQAGLIPSECTYGRTHPAA
jgi:glycosyltransferase involved in cell wall biosynthesis